MNTTVTVTGIVDVYQTEDSKNWERNDFAARKWDGIVFFTEGVIKYHFEDKDITAQKGDILFLPGNLPYCGTKLTDSVSFAVVDFLCLADDELEKIGAPCTVCSKNFGSLFSRFLDVGEAWNAHLLSSDCEMRSFIYAVLSEIYKQDENLEGTTPTDEILEFIAANIGDSHLALKGICKNFFISESQLRRNIYKRTGLSPNEYITALRVGRAKNELVGTEKPVKTIAAECGFASPYYFSKVFSKAVGISPTEYRKQARR